MSSRYELWEVVAFDTEGRPHHLCYAEEEAHAQHLRKMFENLGFQAIILAGLLLQGIYKSVELEHKEIVAEIDLSLNDY